MMEEDLFNVIQRWESLGLLDGLPILEKSELAQIYDNATRLLLSNLAIRKIPKKVSDLLDEIFIPICRRLYKRVGPNFDLDNMMSELLESVNTNINSILEPKSENQLKDSIVEFCVDFSDNYTDDVTTSSMLSDDEYEESVNVLLETLKTILLNDRMVSRLESDGEYELKFVNNVKPKSVTRFWNQSITKQVMEIGLSNINKKNQ